MKLLLARDPGSALAHLLFDRRERRILRRSDNNRSIVRDRPVALLLATELGVTRPAYWQISDLTSVHPQVRTPIIDPARKYLDTEAATASLDKSNMTEDSRH